MKSFERCPVCNGQLVERRVEKLLRGDVHTAILNVKALICLHCGERLYSEETVRLFAEIRTKLERHQTAGFQSLGKSFQVA